MSVSRVDFADPGWLAKTERRVRQALSKPPEIKRPFLAGSHIHDEVALRKLILLCGFCEPKFNYKRSRYVKRIAGLSHPRTGPLHHHVIGACDGCKQTPVLCQAFMPEEGF